MAALAVLGIVAHQVVVFVIPQKRPRADLIALAAVAIAFLPGGVPIEIVEGDAAACGDGAVQGIHIVVDAFVHIFDAVGDVHLTAQGLRLVAAGQLFQLGDERIAFAQGEEFAALHGIHRQL